MLTNSSRDAIFLAAASGGGGWRPGRRATVEMWVSQADPPRSTTVKALQGGADYTSRFTLAERGGGTDLTMTFGAEVLRPTVLSRLMFALFGRLGMNLTRKALAKDL